MYPAKNHVRLPRPSSDTRFRPRQRETSNTSDKNTGKASDPASLSVSSPHGALEAMSNAQDRTASEPREQDDDQFMDEDQMDEGGLFGSGSEDEAAGYDI